MWIELEGRSEDGNHHFSHDDIATYDWGSPWLDSLEEASELAEILQNTLDFLLGKNKS